MIPRELREIIPALETSDGAGVRIRRSLGQRQGVRHDPFLLLDEFGSDRAADYIAGFPNHPHRGFETVTYLLDGHMLHSDHLGNRGELRSGDVQWMTAGRGIIHSEMPQQEHGLMRGFQLWLNLPAAEKMKPAGYRDIPAAEIPQVALPGGGRAKVIAGAIEIDGGRIEGPMQGLSTEPLFVDLQLQPGERFEQALPAGHNALLYLYEGELHVGAAPRALPRSAAGLLGDGDGVVVEAGAHGARVLLLAGKPLREPVAQWGPFVMNTPEELEQAVRDYRDGRLVEVE
jgi:redox-sensitive bicupin YhaK (pirin superfamily)